MKPRAKKRRYVTYSLNMWQLIIIMAITCSDHRIADNLTDELSDDCLKYNNSR